MKNIKKNNQSQLSGKEKVKGEKIGYPDYSVTLIFYVYHDVCEYYYPVWYHDNGLGNPWIK